MSNKKSNNGIQTTQRNSLIIRDCARLTAEHDRIAASYRDLAARLDQAISRYRDEK